MGREIGKALVALFFIGASLSEATPERPALRLSLRTVVGLRGLLREGTDLSTGDPLFVAVTSSPGRVPELVHFLLRPRARSARVLRRSPIVGLVDISGVARTPDGSFWVVDKKDPALVHLSPEGKIMSRERLPRPCAAGPVFFDAIAYRDGHLFVFSRHGTSDSDTSARAAIAFDSETEKTDGVFRLPSGGPLGDAIAYGVSGFLVSLRAVDTERTSLVTMALGPRLPLRTPLRRPGCYDDRGGGRGTALMTPVLELGGSDPDSAAGIALADEDVLAVVNDNRGEAATATLLELYGTKPGRRGRIALGE